MSLLLIQGVYFDGVSSKPHQAKLQLTTDASLHLQLPDDQLDPAIDQIRVMSRLGNTVRQIYLFEKGVFETSDNDAVDYLQQQINGSSGARIHWLEKNLRMVLLSVLLTMFFAWGGVVYGIPAASGLIASVVPEKISQKLGQGSLEFMDKWAFNETRLSDETQVRLRQLFARIKPENTDYHLEFRDAKSIGPNAFALPSGAVVVTDQLVNLSEKDEEIASILAHEIGHLVHKHSLRQLLHESGLAIVLVAITGDISTVSSLVTAAPLLMLETSHSRELEAEADTYAFAYLDEAGIEVGVFANMLSRMTIYHEGEMAGAGDKEESGWLDYLSTHPATELRIQRANQYGAAKF